MLAKWPISLLSILNINSCSSSYSHILRKKTRFRCIIIPGSLLYIIVKKINCISPGEGIL